MERMDQNMPFLLRYENVAWYENGKVRILDRRVFPTEVRFVECETYQEVRQAIADMVTQSAGPYTAVGMGMALAAWQVRGEAKEKQALAKPDQPSESEKNDETGNQSSENLSKSAVFDTSNEDRPISFARTVVKRYGYKKI